MKGMCRDQSSAEGEDRHDRVHAAAAAAPPARKTKRRRIAHSASWHLHVSMATSLMQENANERRQKRERREKTPVAVAAASSRSRIADGCGTIECADGSIERDGKKKRVLRFLSPHHHRCRSDSIPMPSRCQPRNRGERERDLRDSASPATRNEVTVKVRE